MKNKVLAGVCLVAGALGVMAPALPQAQSEPYCEKWCSKRGKTMCCPGFEAGGPATSEHSNRWYESNEQRCQTILGQKRIDGALQSDLENCQKLVKSGTKETVETEEQKAIKQVRQAVVSTPERLKNLPEVQLGAGWQNDVEKFHNEQFPNQSE